MRGIELGQELTEIFVEAIRLSVSFDELLQREAACREFDCKWAYLVAE